MSVAPMLYPRVCFDCSNEWRGTLDDCCPECGHLNDALAGAQPSEAPQPRASSLEFVDWPDLFAGVSHEVPIVDGLAFAGRWTAIAAGAKAGKSTLLLHVATSLVRGRDPFTGRERPPVAVAYLDGEMGRVDVHERLEALELGPADLERLAYTDLPPKLDTDQGAANLAAAVERVGARLVIIDGLNGVVQGPENDDTTWRALHDSTVIPLKRARVALVTADNLGKDATRGPRGSSVKMDKADAVLHLSRAKDAVQLHATHRRTAAYPDRQSFGVVGLDGSQPISYRHAGQVWLEGAAELAAVLDELEVPLDAGRPTVRKALRLARDASPEGDKYRASDDLIRSACAYRRSTR